MIKHFISHSAAATENTSDISHSARRNLEETYCEFHHSASSSICILKSFYYSSLALIFMQICPRFSSIFSQILFKFHSNFRHYIMQISLNFGQMFAIVYLQLFFSRLPLECLSNFFNFLIFHFNFFFLIVLKFSKKAFQF